MCRTYPKIATVAGQVSEAKGLGEDVRHVVKSTNTKDFEFIMCNEVLHGIVVDVEVFNFHMPALIFRQLSGSIIVTVEWYGIENRHI
jgi:phosphoenolpyruvate carboxylase